ncbi:transcriptional regulator of acetoin/glycerol metabolism [Actinomycetospora succinea]|uniref:Transcriptional regulator of acetoin/glycerol metabolism n=1 Tax=Actinomycetospora succinea TaxID=663603 RepID=A0A4R6VR76_9PSEU|nr:helix-turn-helix domain-containing protein [Actinomycetospora succinea]TDQ65054.1 transcriptional regulator of acetoin/glycerol metabolism [Actinomycetospora succinea]
MRRDESRPTLSSAELLRTRRSREALVDQGVLVAPPGRAGVPSVIETSWRRCVGEGVPVDPAHIPYREPDEAVGALSRAAAPVLERLRHSFADVPVAMVLSDETGRIVVRHAEERRQRTAMDRASAVEGSDFSEHAVGTNGLGTVLVERRSVLVRGPEHYNPRLDDLTCAGTPIIEPWTGRMLGGFSLACAVRDVHPLMTAMTSDIGRQIEERLLDEAGERRRRLVRSYLAVDGAPDGAFVVDEETLLVNRRGTVHGGPELHPLLWRFLAERAPGRPCRMAVPLPGGVREALVEPIHDGGRTAFSVRLLPVREAPRRELPAGDAPAPEPWHHVPDVDRALHRALRHGERVAVAGPAGAGKAHTARRVLRGAGIADPVVVDPSLDPAWWTTARTAARAGRGVLVRRAHAVPDRDAGLLTALGETGAVLALALDTDRASDTVLGVVRRLATVVRLPALAQTPTHLPALVRSVLAELPEPERHSRLAPATWDLAAAWHWPGDVAELRATVVALARRARGGVVEPDDLPDELRARGRTPGLLERAERDAVVGALRAADGNRTRAARALGIGRTTLYRKMREFGLE